jgi:hypothetical protein
LPVAAAVLGLVMGGRELDGEVVDVEVAGEATLLEEATMLLREDVVAGGARGPGAGGRW